jgi:prepilin-type N-terminal cleavage/methylation domain-containing protein
MFKRKLPKQEQGFTLIEVLIAILITTLFITIAMQAMVIAAVFKARAKQFAEATTWIQQDLEGVRQQAAIVGYTTLSAAPTTSGSSSSLSVSSTTGFAATNRVQIGTISTDYYTISSISGNTITVTPALTTAQISATPAGTTVSVLATGSTDTTLCYASAQNNGLGNLLSSNMPTLNSSNNTKTIADKTYTLSRTTTVRNVAPYEVLQITYSAAQGTNSPIATLNSEVIPNAAFQCPPY